jgi:hypothetical protein
MMWQLLTLYSTLGYIRRLEPPLLEGISHLRSSYLEPKTLVPQSSSSLELRLVRLGLERDQATLGFTMLARAWFGISLVLYSISLFH